MSWISALAIYFVIWWVVLFAMLPIGLRTQEEAGNVTLGTTESAPSGRHVGRALVRTTIVASLVFGAYFYVTGPLGLGFDDLPSFVPDFG